MEGEEFADEGLQQVYSKLWAKRIYDHTVPCLSALGVNLVVPHTLVFSHGALQAWYFTTKDGSYRKKCLENNVHNDVMVEFCKHKEASDVVAQLTTQQGSMKVDYLTPADLRSFLLDPDKGCGVLQSFVPGEGDYLKSYQVLWTPVSCQIRSVCSQHKAHDTSKPFAQRLGTYDAVNYVTMPLKVQISSHTHKVLQTFTQLLIERLNKIAELNQAEREHSHTKIIETVRYGVFNFRITDSRVYFLGNSELQICILSFDERSRNEGDMIVTRRVLKLEDYGKSKSFSHHPSLFSNSMRPASPDYNQYAEANFSVARIGSSSAKTEQHSIERTAWNLDRIRKSLIEHGGWHKHLKGQGKSSLDEIKATLYAANVFVTQAELLRFVQRFSPSSTTNDTSADRHSTPEVISSIPTRSLVRWIQSHPRTRIEQKSPRVQRQASSAKILARCEQRFQESFPPLSERRRKVLASMYVPTFQPKMCHSPTVPVSPKRMITTQVETPTAITGSNLPTRPRTTRQTEEGPRECQMISSACIHPTSRSKRLEGSLLTTAKKFLDQNLNHYLQSTSPLVDLKDKLEHADRDEVARIESRI